MGIRETLDTQVLYDCDVFVAGGGIAGIAAAVAAARSGKKVILAERVFLLGGLATAGLVNIYLPLCDGLGRQVSFGLAEELLRLSCSVAPMNTRGYPLWVAPGHPTTHTGKDYRYEVEFNPHTFAILAEKLLTDLGVKILYGTVAVACSMKGEKIDCVIIENKSGRSAVHVRAVVDATGDADFTRFTGAPSETFRQGNVLAAWYFRTKKGEAGYAREMLGMCDIPDSMKNENNRVEQLTPRRFTGLSGEELSEQVIASHTSTFNHLMKKREEDPTCEPVTLASIPQVRMTRRVAGEYTLAEEEVHTYFADSVGMVSDWRKPGPVFEVPFRTLYTARVKNLLFAGRCTSVTESMWDIMRVIPCCSVTGEAAGVAAAMSDDMTALDIGELQTELVKRGVVLHEKDL